MKDGHKRAAIYAGISTIDKGQYPETQLRQLRDYVQQRGFALVGEYVDYASGTNEQRPQYHRNADATAFTASQKKRIDVVVVWRYDRFARSTQALINAMKEFHALHVDFVSYQENIDTTGSPRLPRKGKRFLMS